MLSVPAQWLSDKPITFASRAAYERRLSAFLAAIEVAKSTIILAIVAATSQLATSRTPALAEFRPGARHELAHVQLGDQYRRGVVDERKAAHVHIKASQSQLAQLRWNAPASGKPILAKLLRQCERAARQQLFAAWLVGATRRLIVE